jgi:hypothetical protein
MVLLLILPGLLLLIHRDLSCILLLLINRDLPRFLLLLLLYLILAETMFLVQIG